MLAETTRRRRRGFSLPWSLLSAVLNMSFDGSTACTFFVPPLFLILANTRHTLASLDHCLCTRPKIARGSKPCCALPITPMRARRVPRRSQACRCALKDQVTKGPCCTSSDKPTRQKRSMPACSRGESRPEHASTRPAAAGAACSRPAAAARCFLWLTPSVTMIDQKGV